MLFALSDRVLLSQKLNLRSERALSCWCGMLLLQKWNWEATGPAQDKKELTKREEEKEYETADLLSSCKLLNLDILIINGQVKRISIKIRFNSKGREKLEQIRLMTEIQSRPCSKQLCF